MTRNRVHMLFGTVAIVFGIAAAWQAYRLDRMLTQLRLAGKLDGAAGLLLGSFQGCQPEDGSYAVEDVLAELLVPLGVPVLARFPGGHGPANWPLPLHTRVRLDASGRQIELLEPVLE